MSGSGGIKRSGSRKKLDLKPTFETTNKSKKNDCRSKFVPSPGKIMIKIPVSSAATSSAGASTGASRTRDVPVVEVDDDGALTIPPPSFSYQDDTSGSKLVLIL